MKSVRKLCPCLAFLWTKKHGDAPADPSKQKEIEMVISEGSQPKSSKSVEEPDEQWYFGQMNRFDAVALLQDVHQPNGTFLLRRSDHDSGYVLSVKQSNSRVRHFQIHQDKEDSFHVDASANFSSLCHLVEHYRNNTLAKTETLLSHPCPKAESSDSGVLTLELRKEELILEEELSSGRFAAVHRGTWKGQTVAIKIFKDPKITKKLFVSEVQPLKGLQHRHVLSLFAVCSEYPPFYIVMELMEKGSLLHFLKGPEGQHQDIVSLTDLATQVADGMLYLENKGIVHKDLAARNVLVGDGCICKVADFGLNTLKSPYDNFEDEEESNSRWSAPETISRGEFSSKSDVWSFGVLLYEIITFGETPYKEFSDSEVYGRVAGGYRMPRPPRCPAFLYRMMQWCWSAQAEGRPSFSTLMRELDTVSCE